MSAPDPPTPYLPNVYFLGHKVGAAIANVLSEASDQKLPSVQEIYQAVISFPLWYKHWWLNLVANDPVHVFVETTLLISIVYILISRSSQDWRELERDKLTKAEQDELVEEWKQHGRAPLTPPIDDDDQVEDDHNKVLRPNDVIVHKMQGRTMQVQIQNQQERLEVLNFATLDFLGMSTCPSDSDNDNDDDNNTSTSTNPIKDASRQALNHYGCGSCGPRGFYGTMDVHLQLEGEFAKFCGTDGAIMYSDGASTCSSTVAAFCKRGDLLIVDEGIYEPLYTGVTLSRAHVKWFQHNDMKDLRRVLEKVRAVDRQLGRKPNAQRRFIVVEGLYKNTGTIVPLEELVKLKHEFSCRLILDESLSFGTLGATGRGVTELYGKRLMQDVEIATIALENAIGSIGGVTVGNEAIVDHQRLSGSGYCFSASTPPFAAVAAMKSLELLQTRPELLQRLNENKKYLHEQLKDLCSKRLEDLFLVTSDERSPLAFLQVADIPETEYLDELLFLREVVRESLSRGVAVVATGQYTRGPVRSEPPPGIRMTVSATHNKADIDQAVTVLAEAVEIVMSRLNEESV